MANIRDVAKKAGVSVATVSRVMAGNVPVSEQTRKRVQKAMKALDYAPNAFARSLAFNRSFNVGLVISHLAAPFLGRLMTTVESTLRASNMSLIVASGQSDAEQEQSAIRFLLDKRCDGLIVHADGMSDAALTELAGRVPLVVLNRHVEAIAAQCVVADNHLGEYLATRHLIELGHRRIACLTGALFKQDARHRLAGFRCAMAEAGLEVPAGRVIEGDFTEPSGAAGVRTLHEQGAGFTGLVVGNDEMAISAMGQLRALGYALPTDVSVVGYDDELYARHMVPSLTTVHAPVEAMAECAVRLMTSLIDGESVLSPPERFTPQLIERDSACPPRMV
ncbi:MULTISPECIES: LacI family DNA-binding transcriptional regulator [Larsenimonas]|uniref:LacI family DNA-binding transcriptional regulator n=1 Tax=Larsenimonas suaedae TaxID=1851019 RepID=A0ABU1GRU7_9GAMM|nr:MULTISPECIES: LacI family DNA-binding transcriptional regulator [Larsenimonas]MCM2972638.1 LacI family DNA-binding transcriptional regulator [Larsenimonas suaedae]MCM5704614.1 LacI family DNA-binding transcriptional regulator [Larsenimonas salina]MDR5894565.1 LacI family DNA-binding transcriptional regulator [Larsenimonas suaedae]